MRKYVKPSVVELAAVSSKQVAPLGPGLALAGGYLIGRAIKDSRVNDMPLKHLTPVLFGIKPALS